MTPEDRLARTGPATAERPNARAQPAPPTPAPELPGAAGPAERLVAAAVGVLRDPVARGSVAIMASTVITSLLGYVFWLVVARRFGPVVSGEGAAVTSALQATVLLASVGAAAAMVEWLPRSTTAYEWRERVTAGLMVACATSLAGAPLVALLLGRGMTTLPTLGGAAGIFLFTLAAVCFAVGTVLDYVAISERRNVALILRSMLMTGLRVPLLFVPTWGLVQGTTVVLGAWAVAAAISLVASVLSFRGSPLGRTLRPAFTRIRVHAREMRASFVGQHLITVTAMLAGYLLPVIVVGRLSAEDNGYFYITWMLGSIFSIISPAVSTALFAEGATTPQNMAALVRRSSIMIGGLLVVPIVAYLAGGGLLLSLFGAEYVSHGRLLLVILTLSAIPDAVTNIAVAVLRATGRLAEAIWLNGGMLLLCLVGSWIALPYGGIVAVGLAWLGSQLLGVGYVLVRRRHIFPTAPRQEAQGAVA